MKLLNTALILAITALPPAANGWFITHLPHLHESHLGWDFYARDNSPCIKVDIRQRDVIDFDGITDHYRVNFYEEDFCGGHSWFVTTDGGCPAPFHSKSFRVRRIRGWHHTCPAHWAEHIEGAEGTFQGELKEGMEVRPSPTT